MKFVETRLRGSFLLEPEKLEDERGWFARIWCQREFKARGLASTWVQGSISFNPRKGTLRGMHYQAAPHAETKLVRCTRGSIFDVIIDLRPDSPTFLQHLVMELSQMNYRMLYVPPGIAHGFQTLEDNTEVEYQMSEFYFTGTGRGVRWNDPAFGIVWPLPVTTISERDRAYADYSTAQMVQQA